jgi:pyrroline-5-carboxylate reductase
MQVGFIGAGNMARAMARGFGDPVLCSDGGSGRAAALAQELGGRAASNIEVASEADLVILCHKPAQFEDIAREIGSHAKAVASVLGGIGTDRLSAGYPNRPVFCLMPNTPVEVHQGIICYSPAASVDASVEQDVIKLLERLGSVVTVPERLLSAASAVMGVGPAYQALVAEAQVDAAVRHGLKPDLAGRLVAGTMAGTAALLAVRDYDTLAVRREVTSPGGTTARGLDALERAGIRGAFQAAADRVCESQ